MSGTPRINRFLFALTLISGIVLFAATTLSAREAYLFTGRTMGTTYAIQIVSAKPLLKSLWQEKIDLRLKQVNACLSMYQKDSELSRFNVLPADRPFTASPDFYQVLAQCKDLYTLTQGAWDGTVKPLVDLWGFGTKGRRTTPPEAVEIASALARTGFDKLDLSGHTLTKTTPGVTLDLGSIAKGFGVDAVARLIHDSGIKNYLVEIGGELAGRGRNRHRKVWTVGISKPEKGQLSPGLCDRLHLDNMAIATSGNYRNYFEKQGQVFSHIIHPKTGYPVKNIVISASVIAENCTRADGLATALMVMDPDHSLDLINGLENTECLIIRQDNGKRTVLRSSGFKTYEMGL